MSSLNEFFWLKMFVFFKSYFNKNSNYISIKS